MSASKALAVAHRDVSDIKAIDWQKYLHGFMDDVSYLFPSMKPLTKPLTKSNITVLMSNKHSYVGLQKKRGGLAKLVLLSRDDICPSKQKFAEAWGIAASKKFLKMFNDLEKDQAPSRWRRFVNYYTEHDDLVRYDGNGDLQTFCNCGCDTWSDADYEENYYHTDGTEFPHHITT